MFYITRIFYPVVSIGGVSICRLGDFLDKIVSSRLQRFTEINFHHIETKILTNMVNRLPLFHCFSRNLWKINLRNKIIFYATNRSSCNLFSNNMQYQVKLYDS